MFKCSFHTILVHRWIFLQDVQKLLFYRYLLEVPLFVLTAQTYGTSKFASVNVKLSGKEERKGKQAKNIFPDTAVGREKFCTTLRKSMRNKMRYTSDGECIKRKRKAGRKRKGRERLHFTRYSWGRVPGRRKNTLIYLQNVSLFRDFFR